MHSLLLLNMNIQLLQFVTMKKKMNCLNKNKARIKSLLMKKKTLTVNLDQNVKENFL